MLKASQPRQTTEFTQKERQFLFLYSYWYTDVYFNSALEKAQGFTWGISFGNKFSSSSTIFRWRREHRYPDVLIGIQCGHHSDQTTWCNQTPQRWDTFCIRKDEQTVRRRSSADTLTVTQVTWMCLAESEGGIREVFRWPFVTTHHQRHVYFYSVLHRANRCMIQSDAEWHIFY